MRANARPLCIYVKASQIDYYNKKSKSLFKSQISEGIKPT